MNDPDEILTTDEVAALLKVPKRTVYRWTSARKPFYKIGRHGQKS